MKFLPNFTRSHSNYLKTKHGNKLKFFKSIIEKITRFDVIILTIIRVW